jgi:DUF1680 family protein
LFISVTFIVLTSIATRGAEPSKDDAIQPVPFSDVKLTDGFWAPRIETNRNVTIPHCFRMCRETGSLSNFARAAGLEKGGHQGFPWRDAGVYKVIEGASYSLANTPDAQLELTLQELIATIAAAQEKDGYLYTSRTIDPQKTHEFCGRSRWSHKYSHELYDAGHLYEAAVAYAEATGKRALLDVSIKNARLLRGVFGHGKGFLMNHPEVELGLLKLYRWSHARDHLELSKFFLDERGRGTGRELHGTETQDHMPLVEQDEAVGHAVCAVYTYTAMTDMVALTNDSDYAQAVDRIWDNVVSKKLSITGAAGARSESCPDNYDLPNREATNETCVALANAHWNHHLFLLHGDSKYIDVLERVLYNGALSSVSLTGDRFFYGNPLEHDGRAGFNMGAAERLEWMGSACCPTSAVRFLPIVGGFVYATRDDMLHVNLFIGGDGRVRIRDNAVRIRQETRYPWSGAVKITIDPERAAEFSVHIRIPGWARERPVPSDLYRYLHESKNQIGLRVNGTKVAMDTENLEKGFARIRREWTSGDTIDLDLPMPVRRAISHEAVRANVGRMALERGPIVYCVEAKDHDGHALDLALADEAELTTERRRDLLGGVTVIRGTGTASQLGDDTIGPSLASSGSAEEWSENHPIGWANFRSAVFERETSSARVTHGKTAVRVSSQQDVSGILNKVSIEPNAVYRVRVDSTLEAGTAKLQINLNGIGVFMDNFPMPEGGPATTKLTVFAGPHDTEMDVYFIGLVEGARFVVDNLDVRKLEIVTRPVPLTAIPYYSWANRGAGEMAVWLPRDPKVARPRRARKSEREARK